MKFKIILILCMCFCFITNAQNNLDKIFKKHLKFSTIYGAVNGGTSVSDVKTFSVVSGQLEEGLVETPYDYSLTVGIRKIARFGY